MTGEWVLGAGQDKSDVVTTPVGKTSDKQGGQQDVGAALRSVYQKTVEEHVPDEMLDLLGKLG